MIKEILNCLKVTIGYYKNKTKKIPLEIKKEIEERYYYLPYDWNFPDYWE